jgi:hypothetical protein
MGTRALIQEGLEIVEKASKKSVYLRVLGAVAFRIHCAGHEQLFEAMGRTLSDLDFAGLGNQTNMVVSVFHDAGYHQDPESVMEAAFSGGRLIFNNGTKPIHVDVFLDKLEMSHTVNFSKRLDVDYPTLPLEELALEKLQIHDFTEKDAKDFAVLLREHAIGEKGREEISGLYIAGLLANDWGFYYTVTTNLAKCTQLISSYDALSSQDRSIIDTRIEALLSAIEREPKSLNWKMRARIGTKKKWYSDVEDVQR